jgi:plastocyanin
MTRLFIVAALAASSSVAAAQPAAQPVPATLSEWKIAMPRDTVRAGSITFRVTNNGTINHAFYVRGEGVDKGTREIPTKQSASLTVTLKPGTYEVFCPMSEESHKMAGMTRKLIVTAGDAPAAAKPN